MKPVGWEILSLRKDTLSRCIESKSPLVAPATIKSLIMSEAFRDLKWKVLEPLRRLFKDEVRQLGRSWGSWGNGFTSSFPGPGLGCDASENHKERLDYTSYVWSILHWEIRKVVFYDDICRPWPVCCGQERGVQGDERRTRGRFLACRNQRRAMTADWYRFLPDVFASAASRICNEVSGVNRVLYDITTSHRGPLSGNDDVLVSR